MNTKEAFAKSLKPNYLFLSLAIFFFTITIFIGVMYYHIIKEELENPVDLLDAKSGEYSQINIEFLMDDYFAEAGNPEIETKKAYIVYDGKYFYIACLNEEAMDKLQYMLDYIYSEEEMQEPEPVLIKGTATYIPDDLKKMTIESYNEMAGREVVNEDNFNDYFGSYYLDTYLTPKDNISNCIIICLFPLIMGLIFISAYQIKKNNIKKSLIKYSACYDKVLREVNGYDAVYYDFAHTILTKSYCLFLANGLEIYDYQDIVWIYAHTFKYNGIVTKKSLYLVTKDAKTHEVGIVSGTKKNLILFVEMYGALANRLPHALNGYTEENKTKIKAMFKNQ